VNEDFSSRNTQGLFACGESVSKLQCGANLNRAAVSGVIAGNSAARWASKIEKTEIDSEPVEDLKRVTMAPLERDEGIDPENALITLQEAIHPYPVSILRREKSLREALSEVERLRDTVLPYLRAYDPHYLRLIHEVRNMVLCAEMFLRTSLERKESRSGALREDYPYVDNENWLKWIFVKKGSSGAMEIWAEDIPVDNYTFKPKTGKFLHPFWARAEELGFWSYSSEG
jgi:succinate dehydrogenase/fumarate reductase flavoprotein subunit